MKTVSKQALLEKKQAEENGSRAMSPAMNIQLSAMFMALGLFLPFMTGQIPKIGSVLLPMHIPIMLCGLICGWKSGLIVGLLTPLVRSLFFGIPVLYPMALSMSVELAAYGCVSGMVYSMLPERISSVYKALLAAMAAGRICWGMAMSLLLLPKQVPFLLSTFISAAVVQAVPGAAIQLILIPAIIKALMKAGKMPAHPVPFWNRNKTNSEIRKTVEHPVCANHFPKPDGKQDKPVNKGKA